PLHGGGAKAGGRPRANRPPRAAGSGKAADAARARNRSSASRRKPKEPSTILLGLGLGVVVLAGIAAAYLLTRSSDGADETATSESTVPAVEEEVTDTTGSDPATDDVAAGPGTASPPVVEFDQAAIGPIMAGTEYSINVNGGPGSASYQLLVDGVAAAEPAPQLPPVTFEPGRHLLEVKITSPEGDTGTPPVVVYAVGEVPTGVSFRANLASVNVDPDIEGWAEAVRRYDAFVASGHENLQLMPSDWFPSLTPGYWNLFIGGFGTAAEAEAYCDSFGLAVPTDCFPVRFDPDAPAGG
ncbi:MAG: hypothetical protein AAFN30_13445, partial [Actinomycetota bacterium]